MTANTNKTIEQYMILFGLNRFSTIKELNGSYRTLAKLYHPDINRDEDSDVRMKTINEGFRVLSDFFREREGTDSNIGDFTGEKEVDICYNQYKKGFQILQHAFDNYYGDGEDKSKTGKLKFLNERLRFAKTEFAKLVNELPYNQWVDDAIDKIHSINKWLE